MQHIFINLWGHLSYFVSDFHEYLILLFVTVVGSFFATYYLFTSQLSERRKMFFISLIFTFFSLVVIYSGFEAYFRYRFDQSDSLGFLNVTQRWYERHVVYNNYQYRDNKNYTTAKTPGVVRIGVMGDSNTFGYGIKDVNNRFSNLLEKKFTNNGYHVEVYNFGVPGLDTWNEIDEYNKKDKKFHIDILLWQYFLNDAEPPNSVGSEILKTSGEQISPVISFLSQHSFFFDYVYWRLSARYATTFEKLKNADLAQYSIPSVFAYHKKRIDNFTKELQSDNIKTVVLVIPYLKFFPNYPATSIHKTMDTLFKADGVNSLVDLLPYLKGKTADQLVVNRYDSHPNESVHALAAQKLYAAIVPLLKKTNSGTEMK